MIIDLTGKILTILITDTGELKGLEITNSKELGKLGVRLFTSNTGLCKLKEEV